jgi:Zn-dependent protease
VYPDRGVPPVYYDYQNYPYPPRQTPPGGLILRSVNWVVVVAFIAVMALAAYALVLNPGAWRIPGTLILIVTGWVFSLCLHEFAHAATAVMGGDRSPSTLSYLTFNPLKYLHPVFSIVMPVIFLFLGFIPLPGGAVYLRRDLVRSRGWQSAISAAGPLMNLLFGIACAIPFFLNVLAPYPVLSAALAALVFLEFLAVILNLLPVPGLDGFGIITPWLSRGTLTAIAPFINYGPMLLFVLILAVPGVFVFLYGIVSVMLLAVHVDPYLAGLGISAFSILNRGGL